MIIGLIKLIYLLIVIFISIISFGAICGIGTDISFEKQAENSLSEIDQDLKNLHGINYKKEKKGLSEK